MTINSPLLKIRLLTCDWSNNEILSTDWLNVISHPTLDTEPEMMMKNSLRTDGNTMENYWEGSIEFIKKSSMKFCSKLIKHQIELLLCKKIFLQEMTFFIWTLLIYCVVWVEWPLDYLVLWWRATGHETRSIEGSSKAMRNCMFKILSIKIASSEINVDYLSTIGIIEIFFCYLNLK